MMDSIAPLCDCNETRLVPFALTFRDAAAVAESQSLLLVGTVILLPLVLTDTGHRYYVFRGKSSHDSRD